MEACKSSSRTVLTNTKLVSSPYGVEYDSSTVDCRLRPLREVVGIAVSQSRQRPVRHGPGRTPVAWYCWCGWCSWCLQSTVCSQTRTAHRKLLSASRPTTTGSTTHLRFQLRFKSPSRTRRTGETEAGAVVEEDANQGCSAPPPRCDIWQSPRSDRKPSARGRRRVRDGAGRNR